MHPLAWSLALVAAIALPGQGAPTANHGVEVVPADSRVPAATLQLCQTIATESLAKLGRTFVGMPTAPISMVVHVDKTTVGDSVLEGLPGRFAGFARLGADEFHVLLGAAGGRPGTDLRSIVQHELVHVLLDQWAGEGREYVPRWVHEGLAQALTGAAIFDIAEESLMFGVHTRTLPRFVDLAVRFPKHDDEVQLAYAQSLSFMAFLIDRLGTAAVLEAARNCRSDIDFPVALYHVVQIPLATLQLEWEEYVVFGSGAISRFLQRHCFSFLMILGVPLLVIAVFKRRRRDHERRLRLEQQESALVDIHDEEP